MAPPRHARGALAALAAVGLLVVAVAEEKGAAPTAPPAAADGAPLAEDAEGAAPSEEEAMRLQATSPISPKSVGLTLLVICLGSLGYDRFFRAARGQNGPADKGVKVLGGKCRVVDAERVTDPGVKKPLPNGTYAIEALSIAPVELHVEVPADYEPGQPVYADGPHGRTLVEAPEDAKAGDKFHYLIAPQADFKVKVPPRLGPGSPMELKRSDGVRVSVTVPEGLRSGDIFEVKPPVLMVRVPEKAEPGSIVAFHDSENQWYHARVPQQLRRAGAYFAARLPPPPKPTKSQKKATEKKTASAVNLRASSRAVGA